MSIARPFPDQRTVVATFHCTVCLDSGRLGEVVTAPCEGDRHHFVRTFYYCSACLTVSEVVPLSTACVSQPGKHRWMLWDPAALSVLGSVVEETADVATAAVADALVEGKA